MLHIETGDMCKNLDLDSDLQKGLNFNCFHYCLFKILRKWLLTVEWRHQMPLLECIKHEGRANWNM